MFQAGARLCSQISSHIFEILNLKYVKFVPILASPVEEGDEGEEDEEEYYDEEEEEVPWVTREELLEMYQV